MHMMHFIFIALMDHWQTFPFLFSLIFGTRLDFNPFDSLLSWEVFLESVGAPLLKCPLEYWVPELQVLYLCMSHKYMIEKKMASRNQYVVMLLKQSTNKGQSQSCIYVLEKCWVMNMVKETRMLRVDGTFGNWGH